MTHILWKCKMTQIATLQARNRYKDILNELQELERTVKGSDEETDAFSTDTERTDNEFGINVSDQESDDDDDDGLKVEDGIKAFRDRLQQKEKRQRDRIKEMKLKVDDLSVSSEDEDDDDRNTKKRGDEVKDDTFGDKEETFDMDDEVSKLNDWVDAQKRLKNTIERTQKEQGLEVNAGKRKRRRDEFEIAVEEEEDKPLVMANDIAEDEMNDPFFRDVHDASYMDPGQPPAKRQRVKKKSKEQMEKEEKEKEKQQMLERAKLEMMMASGNLKGSYDPEDTELDALQLNKKLDKRLKKNWKLRWLIKKAVKRKMYEQDRFEFDAMDKRFNALTEDPDFALDPTSTKFRDTPVMQQVLSATRRRRARTWKKGRNKKITKDRKEEKKDLSSLDTNTLIESLKMKSSKIPQLIDGQKQRKEITKKIRRTGVSGL